VADARLPLAQRRHVAQARVERERGEVAASWRSLTGVVRQRERGALAIAQGVVTMLKVGAVAGNIWLAGRIRGPRVIRRGVMIMTAARAAGRLFARRQQLRG